MQRLRLIKNGQLTNAAIVLFAKEVLPDYPQCLIKMARFKGQDKLGDFIDNQRVYGNAFKLLAEANAFIRRHLPIASLYQLNELERIDKSTLPSLAVREAIINAICHRDYSHRNTSINLAIYDDRLEIWNNGFLPQGIQLDDLKRKHISVPRNHLIAETFYNRGLVESWGTGTTKMIELCKHEGLPEPEFSEYSSGFSVCFKFREPIGVIQYKSTNHLMLKTRQKAILTIVRKYEEVSIQQILAKLETPPSQRMVQKDLHYLREQGLVASKGSGKNTLWVALPANS